MKEKTICGFHSVNCGDRSLLGFCSMVLVDVSEKCIAGNFHLQRKIYGVFTEVTIKKRAFWDVAPCRRGGSRRFGGTYRLLLHGRKKNMARFQDFTEMTVMKTYFYDVASCQCLVNRRFEIKDLLPLRGIREYNSI